jgi:hypothetical protein
MRLLEKLWNDLFNTRRVAATLNQLSEHEQQEIQKRWQDIAEEENNGEGK